MVGWGRSWVGGAFIVVVDEQLGHQLGTHQAQGSDGSRV